MDQPKNELIAFFLTFFRRYWLLATLTVTLLVASSMAAVYEPIALKNIINWLIFHGRARRLTALIVLYFAAKGSQLVFDMLRDYFWSPVIYSVSRDIERDVYAHLLDLPIAYHADQKSGAAVRAVTRGSMAVTIIMDFTVTRLIPPFFQLTLVSVLLYKLYSWPFSAITATSIIVYTIFIVWSNERRIKYRLEGNRRDDAASGVLVDSITNIETVKYFNTGRSLFHS